MIVRAGDLLHEGIHLDLNPGIGPLGYAGGLEIGVEGARLTARVVPSRGGLLCSGRLEATVFVPCSRCLEPYPFPVARDFELTYLPGPRAGHGGGEGPRPAARRGTTRGTARGDEGGFDADGAPGMEVQISREELDVAYLDEEGSLDTDALAAEQIYLALPMKPLCSDACRGLCPGCGVNLNNERCLCKPVA